MDVLERTNSSCLQHPRVFARTTRGIDVAMCSVGVRFGRRGRLLSAGLACSSLARRSQATFSGESCRLAAHFQTLGLAPGRPLPLMYRMFNAWHLLRHRFLPAASSAQTPMHNIQCPDLLHTWSGSAGPLLPGSTHLPLSRQPSCIPRCRSARFLSPRFGLPTLHALAMAHPNECPTG